MAAIGTLAVTLWTPQPAAAQTAVTPAGPCEVGYVAPTPTKVAVTSVPIQVSSTTADYFVLYVSGISLPSVTELPVLVKRGEDGTTTLADNLDPLSANRYRVEKYSVAQPGDLDGDCVDDITELADLGKYNPINPSKVIDRTVGVVSIDSLETFQEMSFNGDTGYGDWMRNQEFIKFLILDADTDNPITYFTNTNTTFSHATLHQAIDLEIRPGSIWSRGQIVYHPNVAAPDGSMGIYTYDFDALERGLFAKVATYNEILAAAMPLLENDLFYYPSTNEQTRLYEVHKAKFDASRVNVVLQKELLANVDFIALNQAEGYGRLRLMEDGDRPSPFDVAIYQSLPNDLPRVAGTITTVPQTPLSHVNLRAIQNRLPNAFIRDAHKDDAIKALIGGYVYYAVTADGYTIRAATKQEVDDHHDSLRPKTTQTLQRDLTVTTITSLSKVSFADWTAFGVKAANVAELTQLSLPAGTTPVGFAVPFYFYDEFMKQATVGEETILGKKKAPAEEKITLAVGTTLASAVSQMLAHSYFQTDADIQEEMLDDLRDAIKDATSPAWIIKALEDMHATYPDGQSLRYRSSTNNEDLPSFNGAGLYSSKTQDPDETTSDGIDKSIKRVWASLWNYRAFLERDFHRVDHTTVAMGVLVHPNYSNEPVNGVAVSYDPITFQDDAYYVNSQVGEDLVTNPEANSQPEQLLLGSTGAATVLSRSNLATSDQPLMTVAQMKQLRSNLETIHNRFKTLYGVQDGDDYAIEIEFKITAGNKLAIKQARPWIFAESLELGSPTVSVAFASTPVTESAGLELVVTRSGGVLSTPLTVELAWSETGSMLKNPAPTSVTIPANRLEKSVTVPTADREDEHDSVVTVSIGSNSAYTTGTPASASATVEDDDLTQISVRGDTAKVTEGTPAAFTFTRSGSVLEQPLTVSIAVSETGDRLPGTLPTSVTFAAGSASATLSLATVDDSVVGEGSVFAVQIQTGAEYGIRAGTAKVAVEDDELPGPEILFEVDHTVQEGKNVALTLETRRHSRGALTFYMDGSDTAHFVLYGFAEILLFNQQDYDQRNDANQDGVYEVDITVKESGAGSTTVRVTYTVTEILPVVSISGGGGVTEGDGATFTVSASPAPSAALAVDVSVAQSGDFGVVTGARQVTIPTTGSTSFTVFTAGDLVEEVNGSVTATVDAGTGYVVSGANGSATVGISDDDGLPQVSISGGDGVVEGDGATFTVSASPAPSAAVTVDVTVSQSGDFGVTTGARQVTIPTTGSVSLTVSTGDDGVDEVDGSVTVKVDAGQGYTVSPTAGSASVAVSDDDVPVVSITGGGGVVEGDDATFTVSASPVPAGPLTVSVSVAQSGDFGVVTGSRQVTVSTSGSVSLSVTTSGDSTDESDGSVTVTVDAGNGYTVSATQGSVSVLVSDDDDPPPVSDPVVSITGGGGVTEGDNATFTVSASPVPASPLVVDVTVGQVGDFGVVTGSRQVTVPVSGSVSLSVTTSGDSTDEPDGSVPVTVDAGDGYTVSSTAGSATVAVADDDDPPPVSDPAVSITAGGGVTEGDDATFTLTASPVPSAVLTVDVTVTQSGDFGVTTGSRQVTVSTSGSGSLSVTTSGDSVDEVDGSVTVTVDAGSGYTVSSTAGSASVAIADDDLSVCVPVLPSDAVTVAEVTGWRDGHSGAAHVLRWDRVLAALGESSGESAMSVAESRANEGLFMASRWDRVTRTLEALAACNSPPPPPPVEPEISVTSGGGVTEGDDATFTLTASPMPTTALVVDVTVTQQGDFGVTTGSRQVTISTSGSGTLTVTTSGDSTDESDGSVTVTVDAGQGYTVSQTAGSVSVVVSDDDPAVCVPVLPSDAVTVAEVTGWRDGHSGAAHVLRWDRVLAALGEDTGESAISVAESRANEGLFMASRWDRVTRTLEALAACNSPPPPPPVEPEISVTSGGGVTEGDDATFTLTASPVPTTALVVDVTVTQQGDFGVTTGSRQVTISTSGSGTLTVTTSGDSTDESDGSVTVTVDAGQGYTVSQTAGSATVAIADNDDPPPPPPPPAEPVVSIVGGGGVTEGDGVTFTLSASPVPTTALVVDVTVTQQGDFGVVTGSRQVTISTSGSGTLTVTTSGDSVDESDGSVSVTVDAGQGYTVSQTAGSASVAVADDDDPPLPGEAAFSVEDGSGEEGREVVFRVTLSKALNHKVRVWWKTEYGGHEDDDWALPATEYWTMRGWLVFAPGETSKPVEVFLNDDSRRESDEVFTVRLLFPEGATIADGEGIMTIEDND